MKREYKKLLVILVFILFPFITLEASEYISSPLYNVRLRKGPGTNYPSIITIPSSSSLTRLDDKSYDDEGKNGQCTVNKWYKVKYQNETGFICADLLSVKEEINPPIKPSGNWLEDFNKQNFPEFYKKHLLKLHAKYPNWIFRKVNTRGTWNSNLEFQDQDSRSRIRVSSKDKPGWASRKIGDYDWTTNTFLNIEAGGFYVADKNIIAYFMDPRIYIDSDDPYFREEEIFIFQDLGFNTGINEEVIKSTLPSHLKKYAGTYIEASRQAGVSPYFLVGKTLSEIGKSPDYPPISGNVYDCWADGTHFTGLKGYYNFYNWGATSRSNPTCTAIYYAKRKGWNTPEKAIIEGAKALGAAYIAQGQNTPYFQKYNTRINSKTDAWHQYATDVMNARNVAYLNYRMYKNAGITNLPFIFDIPVYKDMPKNVSQLPSNKHFNNHLKTIKINGEEIHRFDNYTLEYNLNYNNITNLNIDALPVVNGSKIEGLGYHKVQNGLNKISIKCTALNGDVRTYVLNINVNNDNKPSNPSADKPFNEEINKLNLLSDNNYLKNIGSRRKAKDFINEKRSLARLNIIINNNDGSINNSYIGTGNKIKFSNDNDSKTYTAIIYGDVSGDGIINTLDILKIQKHILGYSKLEGAFYKAGDTSRDGKVTTLDLLQVQKDILGYSKIKQN